MKRMASLLFAIALSTAASIASGGGNGVEWVNHFPTGLDLAKKTGKPIIIDFWADWCSPCKQMDREVWPSPEVGVLADKFVFISIDAERDRGTAARYHVKGFPTIVLADSWGNAINRHVGYLPADDLVRMTQGFPRDFSLINEWNSILEKNGKDAEALLRIGEFYRGLGVVDLSNRYLEKALRTDEVKNDPVKRESVQMWVGLNYFKMGKAKDARKTFERCLKDAPDGAQCDKAMLGVVSALILEGKLPEARKMFDELEERFPDSSATRQAALNLQQASGR